MRAGFRTHTHTQKTKQSETQIKQNSMIEHKKPHPAREPDAVRRRGTGQKTATNDVYNGTFVSGGQYAIICSHLFSQPINRGIVHRDAIGWLICGVLDTFEKNQNSRQILNTDQIWYDEMNSRFRSHIMVFLVDIKGMWVFAESRIWCCCCCLFRWPFSIICKMTLSVRYFGSFFFFSSSHFVFGVFWC